MTDGVPRLHFAPHLRRCRKPGLIGLALLVLSANAAFAPLPERHANSGSSATPADMAPALTRALPAGSLAQVLPPRTHDSTTSLEGGWRLLRTADPRSGRESIAVSHAPDLLRSDPEFAGLMLRCTGREIELLFVLVQPLSPRSRPQVTLNFDGKSLRFEAAVVPPGTSIRLPPDAAALASGAWQSTSELSLVIDDGVTTKTKGVVILQGLRSAYAALGAACATN